MKSYLPTLALCAAFALPSVSAQTPDPTPVYKDAAAPVEARTEDLLGRLSTDEKIKLLGGTGFTTQPVERLGVPAFQMSDASCGVRIHSPSPAYTASVCLAASWDRELAQKVGASMGRDARARGVYYLLGPGINLYRAPMNGRNFEYLGEDPVLTGGTAAAFIRGVQSQGVAATLKHFAVNNQEFSRHDLSSDVDERTLRELYLRAFQIALREGQPKAVMTSYNPVNGVHASQNAWLISDVLKGEWGFRGLVMSDWDSCYDTLGMANAGLDLEMPNAKYYTAEKVRPVLTDGRVTAATLDEKIRRQLRVAFELGWFDRAPKDALPPRDDAASDAVNVEEARGGITLLKNTDGLLPLDPAQGRQIVVLGPNSDHPVTGGGGSAYVVYSHAFSVLDALQRAGGAEHVCRMVWGPEEMFPSDGETGLQTLREAAAVVVCVGFDSPGASWNDYGPFKEYESWDRTYRLPTAQARLIQKVAKVNPHVVVVLNAGGSVETLPWIAQVPALLHAYYPGSEGNTALAEIIFGKTNPSGKLPFSWEKRWEDSAAFGNYPNAEHPKANTYKEGVFLGYRWFDAKNREPLFPFGFGLSYTKFALSDLQAARRGAEVVTVSVKVQNTGARAGAEVVQVYAAAPAGGLPRPPRELKAYGKVFLQPGESKNVELEVKTADLMTWDPTEKKWVAPAGEHVLQVGDSSRDLPLRATVEF